MTHFSDLGLMPALLSTLAREGYETPTPIQKQTIPLALEGHDILGIAQTGTGKTAAFALPILHKILEDRKELTPKGCRVLVLSPTRELALQIADSFKTYGMGKALQIAAIYGGTRYQPQYKALATGLDVLVATPGRLIDHLEQRTVDLRHVDFLVLDEADQMMDMGFIKPIRQLAAKLKPERQNLFFSATMPKEIQNLVAELLTNPKKVEVKPESTTAERVKQEVIFIEQIRKRALLSELFADDKVSRALVFSRTKHGADKITAYLQSGGIESGAIHGEKSQGQRERALTAFKDGRIRALVATDIAARGIDVDNVTHVINFDLPLTPEAYVHRIGRTARAGQSGLAISFCANDERSKLKDIQRIIRMTLPTFDRRNDKALALMDEAMQAKGIKSKPDTPERVKPPKSSKKNAPQLEEGTDRHFDPEAERVHKRSRKRPERDGRTRSERGDRPDRQDRGGFKSRRESVYDPSMFADVNINDGESFGGAMDANSFKRKPRKGASNDAPRSDRKPARKFEDRDARDNHGARDERPRREGARSDRPFDRTKDRKFGDRKFDDRPKAYDPMATERAPFKAEKPFGKKPAAKSEGKAFADKKPFDGAPDRKFDKPKNRAEKRAEKFGDKRHETRGNVSSAKPAHRKGPKPNKPMNSQPMINDTGVTLKRRAK